MNRRRTNFMSSGPTRAGPPQADTSGVTAGHGRNATLVIHRPASATAWRSSVPHLPQPPAESCSHPGSTPSGSASCPTAAPARGRPEAVPPLPAAAPMARAGAGSAAAPARRAPAGSTSTMRCADCARRGGTPPPKEPQYVATSARRARFRLPARSMRHNASIRRSDSARPAGVL